MSIEPDDDQDKCFDPGDFRAYAIAAIGATLAAFMICGFALWFSMSQGGGM